MFKTPIKELIEAEYCLIMKAFVNELKEMSDFLT